MKALLFCRNLALGAAALTGLCCQPAQASPTEDLGRVLFVGDSITHGKSSGSWRWELFKIFADNGIRMKEVGILSGNYNGKGGVTPGTHYGGIAFANRHAAHYSEKAAEVSGRISEPSRMGGTGIRHWLRLDGTPDGNWQLAEGETPDTFFLAIGTNDFVAEHSAVAGGLAANLRKVQEALIGRKQGRKWVSQGDMNSIVTAMREANPKARIVVIGIPTFGDGKGRWCHKATTPRDYAALQSYNKNLRMWGRSLGLMALDINAGFRDVTRDGAAVATMLVDQMHPNAQGNLIYAGNVAKAMGYAGRTAGLKRRHASEMPRMCPQGVSSDKPGVFRLPAGREISFPGDHATAGATVELDFGKSGYGNGAAGGWKDDAPLCVALSYSGIKSELNIAESGIYWQGRCLYSTDMSKVTQPIRLAYVEENLTKWHPGGFYVWLGDMLIGEALRGTPVDQVGLTLIAGECPVNFARLSYDSKSSWAPDSSRLYVLQK